VFIFTWGVYNLYLVLHSEGVPQKTKWKIQSIFFVCVFCCWIS